MPTAACFATRLIGVQEPNPTGPQGRARDLLGVESHKIVDVVASSVEDPEGSEGLLGGQGMRWVVEGQWGGDVVAVQGKQRKKQTKILSA